MAARQDPFIEFNGQILRLQLQVDEEIAYRLIGPDRTAFAIYEDVNFQTIRLLVFPRRSMPQARYDDYSEKSFTNAGSEPLTDLANTKPLLRDDLSAAFVRAC